MPEKIAHLPDGTTLHFPDDTPDEVVSNKVKEHLSSSQAIPQLPSQVVGGLEQKYTPGNVSIAQKIAPYVPAAAGIAGGAAMAGATGGLGVPSLYSGLLGSGTMSAITNLLQPKPASESHGFLKDTAIDTAWNEGLGRIIGGIVKGATVAGGGVLGNVAPSVASKFNIPGVDQSLLDLLPTTSQLAQSRGGKILSQLIEKSFSPSTAARAYETTEQLTKDQAQNIISRIATRGLGLDSGEDLGEGLQKQTLDTYKAYRNVGTIRGNAAKSIADNGNNTQQIPIFQIQGNPQNLPMQPGTQPAMIPTGRTYAVNGAVIPTSTIKEVQAILGDIDKSKIKPDPNDPVVKKLHDILNSVISVDPQTGEKYYHPAWNFGDAWETKKVAGDIGYEGVTESGKTIHDIRFQRIEKAVDQDIRASLANSQGMWNPDDAKLALSHYDESVSLAKQRYALFGASQQTGGTIQNLINRQINGDAVQSPVGVLNDIFDDPKKTQQFLNGDKTPIDTETGTQYIFNNKRREAAAYQAMRIMNNSLSPDSVDPSNRVFDVNKFTQQLRPNDASKYAANRILFNAQDMANLDQFGKNLAATQMKGDIGARPYWYLRSAATGMGVAASLLAGAAGNLPGAAGLAGGTFALNQIGKLLTNPSSARLMVSLANNGPLNMTTQAAGRIIANVLKNETIALKYADGSEVNARFGSDGKLGIPLK